MADNAIRTFLTEQFNPENTEHRKSVWRMLQALYLRQTADEQESEITSHHNGQGFNGTDAQFLSSVAKTSQQYGNLTVKQAAVVAKRLKKYSNQLMLIKSQQAA